ncbi:flagellar basal body-associated FliL family protein [Marinobacter sp. F4206]|uniref:flagellar basal body-associated FliL family protein n=1 Tax=Marinobacter sp. F4206 TaxID=2861777 RepID=UPI001C5F646C|nr:flagellar basal body-associated FliL family protein [Marinobacter sp. F4206]MBW4933708.1 flagellar basal body-associated FliL family protein [Marinobacter sp. F4206]
MAENNAPEAAPAKKGKLKLIIMLVVIVILAIVLSVAGTLWFLGGSLPGMAGGEEEGSDEAVEESFVSSTYVELQKALVTTVQAEGRQRYAQVYLALEATDPQALAAAQLHLPLIRSQLVMVLGSSKFDQLQTPEGRRGLADEMLTTVNQVLEQEGEPAIKRVLFRNFVVQ